MAFNQTLVSIFVLSLLSSTISQSLIQQIPRNRKIHLDDSLYCDSWRLSVETNNAGPWLKIPLACFDFVQNYMLGERYLSDSNMVANDSLAYAKTVQITGDGKDAWVFDIDETLLSNVPYYQAHGFGSEIFDEVSFDNWADSAEAPALPASLNLYKELKQMGFTIFLLTGRSEHQRNATTKNLQCSGYSNWESLLLRGNSDQGAPATVYKSKKRSEIISKGYRIHGNSGDQWSDLLGSAVAKRSFKLPNPMYYIP